MVLALDPAQTLLSNQLRKPPYVPNLKVPQPLKRTQPCRRLARPPHPVNQETVDLLKLGALVLPLPRRVALLLPARSLLDSHLVEEPKLKVPKPLQRIQPRRRLTRSPHPVNQEAVELLELR